MQINKFIVWIMYLCCVLAILFGSGWIESAGRWILGITLLLHLVEFVLKRDVMSKAGGSMGYHFVQTMIYGLFHWKPLEDQQHAED